MDYIHTTSERIGVSKTVYPKNRLSLNDWYKYIHQAILDNKFKNKE